MRISHDEFVRKYDGKFLEVAGSANAKNQCVDCVNGYLKEVLDQPIVEWTNARDFPSKLTENFDWFDNDPDAIPLKGDILVWQHNEWGHIAVCDSAEMNSLIAFGENYPTGTPCHLQRHTYLRPKIAGWLRFKNSGEEKIYSELEMTKMREERDNNWTLYQGAKDESNTRKKQLREFIEKLAVKLGLPMASDEADCLGSVERLLETEDQSNQKDKVIAKLKEDYEDKEKAWEKKLSDIQKKLDDFAQENLDLKSEVNQLVLEHKALIEEKASFDPSKQPTTRFKLFLAYVISIFKR